MTQTQSQNERLSNPELDEAFSILYNPEAAASTVLNILKANRNAIVTEYRALLGDAVEYLDDDITIEIRRNGNSHIYVQQLGKPEFDTGIVQNDMDALQLGTMISAVSGLEFTRRVPSLEFILPFHGARFSIISSPIQSAPMWAIRKRIGRIITLDEYRFEGLISEPQFERLQYYIEENRPIIIIAPQRVGKTTFAQALLTYVLQLHPDALFGIIEDTPEINLPTNNKFEWLTCPQIGFDFDELIKRSLRYGAKSCSIGELRGHAAAMIESWTIGGQLTAITSTHGKTAVEGCHRIEQLFTKEKVPINRRHFKTALGAFLCLAPSPNGKPYVSSLTHIESISASGEYRFAKEAS